LGKPSGRRTFYAEKPWWDYHERLAKPLGKIMGALPSEITVMNTLTVTFIYGVILQASKRDTKSFVRKAFF
jgi:kynureninase